jgi:RNA polymerase sigma-70 factor (ECF subfamily)
LELIGRFEPQIRSYVQNRAGGGPGDDLYQDTIAAALAAAQRFEYQGDAQFLSWIYTIARRQITQNRRRMIRPALRLCRSDSSAPGVPESRIPGCVPSPSSAAARSEHCLRLRDAMNSLPDAYREILMLYKIEERPLGEVARILNKSKSATCHLLSRALAHLNEVLSE